MPRKPFEVTPEIAEIVARDRVHHPEPEVRERLLALHLTHLGRTREETAEMLGIGRKTLQRWLALFRKGGLEAMCRLRDVYRTSELEDHRDEILEMFAAEPPRTIAEAAERIRERTGLRRGETQVRRFLKKHRLKYRAVRTVPLPPKKVSKCTSPFRKSFSPKS